MGDVQVADWLVTGSSPQHGASDSYTRHMSRRFQEHLGVLFLGKLESPLCLCSMSAFEV